MTYGSRAKPVSLDPFQTIVEVRWASVVSFLIVSYRWTDGRDFDLAAQIESSGIVGLDDEEVGWIADQRYSVSVSGKEILKHSGDVVETSGVESVSVDVKSMLAINKNLHSFVLAFRGSWYSLIESGNVTITVKLYSGGTLGGGSYSDFTVTGGKEKYSLVSGRFVSFQGQEDEDYGNVGRVTFTKPSKVILT